MLGDNQDKETMRNQLIGIVLMTLLVIAWFQFYAPKPGQKPAQPQSTTVERAPEDAAAANVPPEPGVPATLGLETQAGAQWPYLPPVATQEDPAQDEVTIQNQYLKLVFTRVGARLKSALVLLQENGANSIQLVPPPPEGTPDAEAVYPLGLRFTDEAIGDGIDLRRFEATVDPSGRSVTFTLDLPNAAVIRKTFSLDERAYMLDAQVAFENLESTSRVLGMDQIPAFSLNWGPNVSSGDEKSGVRQAIYWYRDKELDMRYTAKMSASNGQVFSQTIPGADWVAVKSAYFVVALKTDGLTPVPENEKCQAWLRGEPKRFRVGLAVPRFEVAPGATQTAAFSLYVGPSQLSSLAAAWDTLPQVQRFFSKRWDIMDRFAKLLLSLLNWFYAHIFANYGVAIIFLTAVVRMVMYPLTLKSMRSMKRMQMLAPEVEALKATCGKDPQELNKKMMELYKERGVNPMGGCLPMALQMPVFIALYRMLWSAYELRGAPFVFWITDLSQPDQWFRIPYVDQVPFLANFHYFNLLPILMGLSMVLSQKVMPTSGPAQNPQQKFMMNFMPIFFSFICYRMASGLNLYILTSTVLGMVQQKFIRAGDVSVDQKKKTPRKRQHFYTAAQERKRRLAKEDKQGRKGKRARP